MPGEREAMINSLIRELRAKAWQSASRRNSAGGLSRHTNHVCWKAADLLEILTQRAEKAEAERDEARGDLVTMDLQCTQWAAKTLEQAERANTAEASASRLSERVKALEGVLEPFARVTDRMADMDEEAVLRLVYDDPEWGDNAVLCEWFVRPFRAIATLLSQKDPSHG